MDDQIIIDPGVNQEIPKTPDQPPNNQQPNEIFKIRKDILLFFGFIMIGVGFWVIQLVLNNYFFGNSVAGQAEAEKTNSQNIIAIDELNINAESAISVGVDGKADEKVLFKKNEEKKLPMASLAKLMTTVVVLENYNLSEKVKVNKLAEAEIEDQGNLKEGEVFSVKGLLYMTLIESNNRATQILSGVIGSGKFVEKMNKKAEDLGLKDTHFEDSTGISPNSYSTAKDVAKLSEYLFLNYPLFREIISYKEFNLYSSDGLFHHKLVNTNKLIGEPSIIGGKTGWTEEARGCFMTIQKNSKNGNYLIHVILSAEDRFEEMKKLINRGSGDVFSNS